MPPKPTGQEVVDILARYPGLTLRERHFSSLGGGPLAQGDVIVGVEGKSAIDSLEAIVVERITGYAGRKLAPQPDYRDLLSEELKPVGFSGNFQDGVVFVASGETPEKITPRYSLVVASNLTSSGRGVVGAIARNVNYHGAVGNSTIRVLSRPPISLKKARELKDELGLATPERGQNVARYALATWWRPGLPQ